MAESSDAYPFLKGHGTENDFVLLPDHDGTIHGGLGPEAWSARVVALCDRRAGIGGDGVLRVLGQDGGWFMDYWNADGSVSEMCGNGVRVFARHLLEEGLVDPAAPIEVGTRDGIKAVRVEGDGQVTVAMGRARVLGTTSITVGDRTWPATHVDIGNPHAVVVVEDLAEAGSLRDEPTYDAEEFPHGVNVEFVHRTGERAVEMRVHERGSGETRSCGTGACAAVFTLDPATYTVDVPGGRLVVTCGADQVLLTGPAVIVARGRTAL